MQQNLRYPLVPHIETTDTVTDFEQEVGHEFGTFQNLECMNLKNKLVDMEYQGIRSRSFVAVLQRLIGGRLVAQREPELPPSVRGL